ncbi:MAG: serine/threonine-protein kinase [Verrucomicrobiota bacterium]
MRRCSQCGAEFDGMLCPQCLAHVLAEDEGGYFELPERLGGFQLLERVARGASGEVWRAFQPGPDREVALKVFLDPALGGVADRARFDLEAQALGKLDHPAVVPVYAAGEEGGFLFIASRWMPGGTLADLEFPEEKSRVVQKRIGGLVAEVVHAVAYAHRHGLIHRDIKPENVLVDREGRPYLADFGIALGANQGEGSSVSGTPGFMAPEQAQGEFAKTTADIFSLGAILYHLLVGCPPDSEEQRGGEGLERVDRELRAIVLRCLRGLPEERYQSAESLAEDLEDWLAGKPVSAYPVGPTVRLWKWSRRHPAIAALAFLSALILVVLGVTLVVSSRAIAEERNEAVAQRGIAERNERLARREEYRAAVYAASQGLAGGNLGQAQRLLDEQIPGEGEEDLRGFEWDALSSLTASLEWRRFEGHELAVTGLAFSPDSRYLASVGRDQRVFVQEVETGEVVMELPNGLAPKKGPLEIPLMAGLIARSRALREAVRSGEETFDGLKMKGRPSRLGELTAVVWAPDGERLATAGQGGMVRVWSFPEGKLVQLFLASVVKQMAYSDDGRFLVVAYRGREGVHTVAAFEVETGERVFLREHVGLGFGMREGELVFFDGLERELVFVELADWTELKRWECAESVSRLCFSEDGEELYGLADRGNEVWTWNLSTRKLVSIDDWKHRNVRVLVESSYGLVTSGVAQSVNLPGEVLRGHEDEVLALAVSPDEKWIASGGKDETIRLWSLPEVALRKAERERPSCPVSSMSPDGRLWLVDPPKGEVSR